MSVFFFFRQDSVAKTKLAGFCQVKSRQKECPVTDFKARTGAFILARQGWLKGLCEPSGQNMEAWKGMGREVRVE